MLATFLCEHSSNAFLAFHKPDWNEKITLSASEKLSIIHYPLSIKEVFPWSDELSEGIDHEELSTSFFDQPDLFLRIRPGKKNIVIKKLEEAAILFRSISEDCIAFPNSSKIDLVLEIDKEVVVQDASSQRVLDHLKESHFSPGRSAPAGRQDEEGRARLWDCCAASGGKSILAYDILHGNVELTVSDIRESILSNLKKRFNTAGIKNYHSFITDLNAPDCQLPIANCQLILCDAPCTGSGTWGRTPEQLYFFDPAMIDAYAQRQKNIVSNAMGAMQKDGLFYYITCSVFKKENEQVADFIKEKFHMELLQMKVLTGYDNSADTMFVAVFKKN